MNETFLETLKNIFDRYGLDMLNDPGRLNAFLMDMAPDSAKERKLVCSVLSEGIGSELRRAAGLSGDEQLHSIRKCIYQIRNDTWIAADAAELAVNMLAASIGISCASVTVSASPAPAAQSSGSPAQAVLAKGVLEGDIGDLSAALRQYTEIGYKAFAANTFIEDAIIPDTVRTVRPRAFQNCINLEKVSLPASLEELGAGAFMGCSSLRYITADQNRKFTVVNGMLIDKQRRALIRAQNQPVNKDCEIPEAVTEIEAYAFDRCPVKSIRIPKSISVISPDAFIYCMETERFEADPKNQNFSTVGGVLHSRSRQVLIRYPSGCPGNAYYLEDEVSEIAEGAFSCAASLESVTFTNNLKKIGSRAFENCVRLRTLMLPASVEVIGEKAFQFCDLLTSVMLPRSIKEIGDLAFNECRSVQSLSIPLAVERIGHAAFKDCERLSRVVIQNNVNFIGNGAFDGCHPELEVCIRNNPYAETYCRARKINYSII